MFLFGTFIWLDCFIRRAFTFIIVRLCKETVKSKIPALYMGWELSCLCAACSSMWEQVAECQMGFWTGCKAIKHTIYNQTHSFWLL